MQLRTSHFLTTFAAFAAIAAASPAFAGDDWGKKAPAIIGVYDAVHAHWSDAVIISADGTYKRGNGDPGKWTFDGKTLTLNWTNWGPEPVRMTAPGKFANDAGFALTKRPLPAWFLGAYQGAHPHWGDSVTLNANYTYQRGNGDGGNWTFDGTTLTLHWTTWGPEPVTLEKDGRFSNKGGFSLTKITAPAPKKKGS